MSWAQEVEKAKIISLESCYRLIDVRRDAGDNQAADAIGFAARAAERTQRHLKALAWAAVEKSAAKRRNALEIVRMEIEAAGESTAFMPMKL